MIDFGSFLQSTLIIMTNMKYAILAAMIGLSSSVATAAPVESVSASHVWKLNAYSNKLLMIVETT